jgi:hypothetical protein
MPLSLKHKYVSPRPDTSDPTVVQSSNWNDEHDLITDGLTLLGRGDPDAGTVEVLTPAQARTVLDVDNLFAPIVHDHDDLYYTEGEVDTFLAAKEEILLQPYSYENRGNVRSVDGYGDNKVFIESLGMFRWVAGSTEIDDDETCFSTATGAWLLEAAAWDFVFANWYPEIDNISSRLSDVETTLGPGGAQIPSPSGFSGRFLTTNGVDLLWGEALPTQTGLAGRFLFTNGTVASWEAAVLPTLTLTAGAGLLGGGTLAADRSFSVDVASVADLRAGTAGKIVDAAGVYAASAPVALTDGATITPVLTAGRVFSVTLGGNRTLANPTGQIAGQSGVIIVTQDATGSRTLVFGNNYKFSGGAPTLTTASNSIDMISYYVQANGTILCTFSGGFV